MNKLQNSEKILVVNDSAVLTGCYNYATNTVNHLRKRGYEVKFVNPTDKGYISIKTNILGGLRWALFPHPKVLKDLISFKPDYVLIVTVEAPIGKATKEVCKLLKFFGLSDSMNYTLSYTTDIKKYYQNLFRRSSFSPILGKRITSVVLDFIKILQDLYTRIYYSGATRVMVNSDSAMKRLEDIGVKNIVLSPRGIDQEVFRPPNTTDKNPYTQYDWYIKEPLPIFLYLGRLSQEKNIEAFLMGDYPGCHRVVVGDGPEMENLKKIAENNLYIHFLGAVERGKTAPFYQFARLSFFTSLSDPFGNTIIESCACGTPVIGYNVQGPQDVIKDGVMGVLVDLDKSLFSGVDKALEVDRMTCSKYTSENYSWDKATSELIENLIKIEWKE